MPKRTGKNHTGVSPGQNVVIQITYYILLHEGAVCSIGILLELVNHEDNPLWQ
jgi:hypothetical protein